MRRGRVVRISMLTLMVASLLCAGPALAKSDDEKALMGAVEDFYAALNLMFTGDLVAMREVWSHADDVTYMGPTGGFQIGWEQVLANWEAQAAMRLGGTVVATDMRLSMGRSVAVAYNYEIGENTNVTGESNKVSIRATNVFRKEGGKWKMIGHHTDLLPYLDK